MSKARVKVLAMSAIVIVVLTFLGDMFGGKLMLLQGIPAGDAYLTTFELWQTKTRARDGDVASMKSLESFYGEYKADRVLSKYWMQRAAEAGDPDSQFFLGSQLLGENANSEAGLAWMQKAAKNGSSDAIQYLKERSTSGKQGQAAINAGDVSE